jgi:hypothetical protein
MQLRSDARFEHTCPAEGPAERSLSNENLRGQQNPREAGEFARSRSHSPHRKKKGGEEKKKNHRSVKAWNKRDGNHKTYADHSEMLLQLD